MTKVELDIQKLQWRASILEMFSIATFAGLAYSLKRIPAHEFAQVTMQTLDNVSTVGETLLLSPETPEDQRVLLSEEFSDVVKQVKASFASVLTNLP
jgi:hypothetical protein